jgi:chromosome partitioning protein
MRRTSIVNFKGGTGKTSVTTNLGHALARSGKTVLVIDGDRQSNLTTTLLGKRVKLSLSDVITGRVELTDAIYEARPNLYVISSSTDLDHVSTYLKDHHRSYYIVRDALLQLEEKLDVVLFDQAGMYSPIMDTLLTASNEMLIPCELEPYAVQGLFDMFDKLERELGQKLRNVGIIPYNTDMTKKMTGAYMQEMLQTFGNLVTDPVRTDAAVSYAQSVKMTIFEYAEKYRVKSRAAEDFTMLAHYYLELTEERKVYA